MKKQTMKRWLVAAAAFMLAAGSFAGTAQAAGNTFIAAEIKKPEKPVEGYVIADSASKYLKEEDLKALNADELRIARNEIFARHGRQFYYDDLKDYFSMCTWYKGTVKPEDFNMAELSHLEAANVMLIAHYESVYVEPAEDASKVAPEKDYILEFSSSKYLTVSDLTELTADELRLARNEIYARHGRRFYYEDLQKYFDGKSWYKGTVDPEKFNQDVLNDYEATNVLLIKNYEDGILDAALESPYILPESNTRYLEEKDLYGLDAAGLRLARNEIYARYGRKFLNKDLQDYFNAQSWYKETIEAADFDTTMLTHIEATNVMLIVDFEKKHPDGVPKPEEKPEETKPEEKKEEVKTGFILNDSSSSYITEADLIGLSAAQLRLARNEIYARHGRKFLDKELQDYFNGCFWYEGKIEADDFDPALLSRVEYVNIALIEKYEEAAAKAAEAAEGGSSMISGYILPESDSRFLTEADLAPLSSWQLRLARNEIFARHGRLFATAELQAYFDTCTWYNGLVAAADFDQSVLNEYEAKNAVFISDYEIAHPDQKGGEVEPPKVETPKAEMDYQAFLDAKGYVAYETGWGLAADKYAMLDVNQDGTQELIIQGPASSNWYNALVFTKNAAGEIVKAAELHYYNSLRYSGTHKALFYTEMKPSVLLGSYVYAGLNGTALEVEQRLAWEPVSKDGKIVASIKLVNADGSETPITEADRQAAYAELSNLFFLSLS